MMGNYGFAVDEHREIVATNNKQRYEFPEDMTCIRACQSHGIQVDVELPEATPPDLLYHGTAKSFVESIMSQGIQKGVIGNFASTNFGKVGSTDFRKVKSTP